MASPTLPAERSGRAASTAFAARALVLLLVAGCRAEKPETWTDGFVDYQSIAPLRGYFVFTSPPLGRDAPPKDLLAGAQRMTPSELYGCVRGSCGTTSLPVVYVFPNQGSNVLLWKGPNPTRSSVSFRVWNGTRWEAYVSDHSYQDVNEVSFSVPPELEELYLRVVDSRPDTGGDSNRQSAVRLGRAVPDRIVLQDLFDASDAVVYLPDDIVRREQRPGELLDCLKGELTRTELASFMGFKGHGWTEYRGTGSDELLYLNRTPDGWKLRAAWGQQGLIGPYGRFPLELLPEDRAWLVGYPRDRRWRLARRAAEAGSTPCTLRNSTPPAHTSEWLVLELTAGLERPARLFRRPRMAHQRDGGEPLFGFEVTHAGRTITLQPQGRFGGRSFFAERPERNEELELEYRFVASAEGVVKLALRPLTTPWRAEVNASWTEDMDPPWDEPSRPPHQCAKIEVASVGPPRSRPPPARAPPSTGTSAPAAGAPPALERRGVPEMKRPTPEPFRDEVDAALAVAAEVVRTPWPWWARRAEDDAQARGLRRLTSALQAAAARASTDRVRAARAAEGIALEDKLLTIAAYRAEHPQLLQELAHEYLFGAAGERRAFSLFHFFERHLTEPYRLAWEYYALAPTMGGAVNRSQALAVEALGLIADARSSLVLELIIRTELGPRPLPEAGREIVGELNGVFLKPSPGASPLSGEAVRSLMRIATPEAAEVLVSTLAPDLDHPGDERYPSLLGTVTGMLQGRGLTDDKRYTWYDLLKTGSDAGKPHYRALLEELDRRLGLPGVEQ